MKLLPTDTPYSYEHANESKTSIKGVEYLVWDNYMTRSTVAQNVETGEIKVIKYHGYIGNDLTARKAIASCFHLDSFRK